MVRKGRSDASEPTGHSVAALVDQLSLWPHQMAAVERINDYISAFHRGAAQGSALVQMPTGSGKTGVIAALARCVPGIGCALVLTPRKALRAQLAQDIGGRFFQRLASAPEVSTIPKEVVEVDRPFGQVKYGDIDDTVFVATIQALNSMSGRGGNDFERLQRSVSLVLFDEGHYEPAPKWSRAVRSLPAPKVILTATPYRNDFKVFDLNLHYGYSYTYQQAVEATILRQVEFVAREHTDDPQKFIEDVLDFYDHRFAGHGDAPRVIIRCERRATIRQIAAVLEQHGRTYVAIHEGFSDTTGHPRERKTVPDPTGESATFWIHQFKLMEGIDDARFQVLALFEPLGTARQLVQQVGRIIRNPGLEPSAKGYVLDHSNGMQLRLWEGFLRYDEAITRLGPDALGLAVGEGWLPRLLDAQPPAAYLDGRFRAPLDLDALVPSDEILVPLRTNLLRKLDGFDLDGFCTVLQGEYEEQDRLVRRYDESDKTVVFVYMTFTNSVHLSSSTFIQPSLGVSVIHELDEMVAFYDSLGYVPLYNERARVGKPVDADSLKKLFRRNPGSNLTRVSLRNTNLGARAIRSRSFSAAAVRDTVSAFDDHAQVCTTASGYSIDDPSRPIRKTRRYVGFGRGRISQSSGEWGSLGEYVEWLHEIEAIIQGRTMVVPTFRRYAPEEVEVTDATPVHILLDLFEVEDAYLTLPGRGVQGGRPLEIEDVSCEIENGHFRVAANGADCDVSICYDSTRHRYKLESAHLERLYKNTRPFDNRGVVDYLNQEQSFRVIPKSTNVIYVLGQFYKPIFKVGRGFNRDDFEVSKILVPCPALTAADSEKAATRLGDQSGWAATSLFGMIDDLGVSIQLGGYFGDPDIVVCDDMGTEAADFILADTGDEKRVVFIHAQASAERRPYSASALHKICGQATKNINYLGMFNEQNPPNVGRWDGAWPSDNNPQVARRIRKGAGSGPEIWSKVQSIVRHPLADRQVWLFLGRTLSQGEFERRLGQATPSPEAVQAAFLLHATMASVASVAAKLRVFCCP